MDLQIDRLTKKDSNHSLLLNNKTLTILIAVILIVAAVLIGIMMLYPSEDTSSSWTVSGMLFVDDQPYSGFATVTLLINDSAFTTEKIVMVSGEFIIRGEGSYNESGEFIVEIDDTEYSPVDTNGKSIEIVLNDVDKEYFIDLFVDMDDSNDDQYSASISFLPGSYDFGNMLEDEKDSTILEIWNSGSGTLSYSLSETCSWVTVNPYGGDSTGEHDMIMVDVDTAGLAIGDYSCDIDISSNGGSGIFQIMVSVVQPSPKLSFSPTSYDFGSMKKGETDDMTLEIWNSGSGLLNYSISESCSWLTISQLSGSSSGERDSLSLEVNTADLSIGSHSCDIQIDSDGGSGSVSFEVSVITDDDSGDDSDDDSDDNQNETDDNASVFSTQEVSLSSDGPWQKDILVGVGDIFWINVSVDYNGSDQLPQLVLRDVLPTGLMYHGNLSCSLLNISKRYDEINNTLYVTLSNVTPNQTIEFHYSIKTMNHGEFDHVTNISGETKYNTTLSIEDVTHVKVFGFLSFKSEFQNASSLTWNNQSIVHEIDTIWTRLSVVYNGSFTLSNITVQDKLPENVTFVGKATVNGVIIDPNITGESNKTLRWNLSSIENDTIEILYLVKPLQNSSFEFTSTISAFESSGHQFIATAKRDLQVIPPNPLNISKLIKTGVNQWGKELNCSLNEIITFNISITNDATYPFYSLCVLDILPENLSYINGTARIRYKNLTYALEPTIQTINNSLLWDNINSYIGSYLNPEESFYLYFDSEINAVGTAINKVNVSVCQCSNCTPHSAVDTAQVSSFYPTELQVDAGGPYSGYVNENITLIGSHFGGTPPYLTVWDVDEDSDFTDGDTSVLIHRWNTTGVFNVSYKVIDGNGSLATDTAQVTVNKRSLSVNAGGPYQAREGSQILFQGTVSGGITPYTYQWDFGDGNSSNDKNPLYIYENKGSYIVRLNVTDATNKTAEDTALVQVTEPDMTPPQIIVEKPIKAIYLKNEPVFPFFTPLVFGSVNITINVTDEDSDIDAVTLYLNDAQILHSSQTQISWEWNERCFGRHKLVIMAEDQSGNVNMKETIIWKFF